MARTCRALCFFDLRNITEKHVYRAVPLDDDRDELMGIFKMRLVHALVRSRGQYMAHPSVTEADG